MHKNYEITKGFGTDGEAGLEGEKQKRRARPMKIRVMIVREGRPTEAELSNPQAVYQFMKPKCRRLDREHFWRIDLDARSKVLGYEVLCGESPARCNRLDGELVRRRFLRSSLDT